MKYFYTGAQRAFAEQKDPELSLGGNISSTQIPNDLLQNIFSEASYLSVQQKKRETKLIVLQNDSKTLQATGLSLNFIIGSDVNESVSEPNTDFSMSQYRVAFVESEDGDCFESIINSAALPMNATFEDVVSDQPIVLPDMDPESYLGIWLTRLYDTTSDDLRPQDLTYWNEQLENPTTPGTEDTLDLVLDYTLV